jgi:hypothetical protein
MTGYFRETVEQNRGRLLLGADHYYNLDLDWDQNSPSPKYASKCLMSMELLRGYGFVPTVFEMPSGSLSDWPPILPNDAACAYALNLAVGMKGLNYYVFAGGKNPPDAGTTANVYDYGAPVSPEGETRALFESMKGFNEFLDRYSWLAGAWQAADCRIGYSLDQSRHPRKLAVDRNMLMPPGESWSFMRKGLLLTGLCAHWSPQWVDLAGSEILERTDLPLLVAGSTVMSAHEQQQLVAFLQAGGNLIISPVVPTLDENYRQCGILRDFLGGIEQRSCTRGAPLATIGDVDGVFINGGMFEFTHRPTDAQVIAQTQQEPTAIGIRLRTAGGGSAAVLGCHWRQSRREHERALNQVLLQSGGNPLIECDNPNVWTMLRTDGTRMMLFLMNLWTHPMKATVRFGDPIEKGRWHEPDGFDLPANSVWCWTPDEGVVFRSDRLLAPGVQ